jgi:ubiquitin-protein ligase/DNA-directed RNA polymerase subunit RPC12/RpoP
VITFACGKCGKSFSVPGTFAGRKAHCKKCGGTVIVPQPTERITPAPPAGMVPMRTRRLLADAEQMRSTFKDFGPIQILSMDGDPPESYRIEYHLKSLEPGRDGRPVPRLKHIAEIQLMRDYPRLAPKCKLLTPIFHPNIDPTTICVGDHWTAGERLADLVVRIGEMLAYQAYNIKSPLDGEAAMWADLHADKLPTDNRNLHPAVREEVGA